MDYPIPTEMPGWVMLAEGTIASDFALKNLNKALGEAQIEFLPAVKDAENRYANYQYTPLESIVAAVRPSLVKHHLTVSQFPVTDLERRTIAVYTRIVHWDSGEWMQNMLEVPGELALGRDGAAKFNQQTIGGSQTYAQKYAYKAIVGIPDAEETIDSSEEKGDLPARAKTQSKTQRTTPRQADTDYDVAAESSPGRLNAAPPSDVRTKFFSKAKEFGWGLADIKRFIVKAYPDAKGSTASLTEEQLQDALKVMASNKPEDVLADQAE